jgi:tRNA(fMet)-specific endonuclease VapC
VLPTIALAELCVWAYGKDDPNPLLKLIEELLADVSVLPFDVASAYQFGRLRVILRKQGVSVSPPDLMIGAMAVAHDLILVTDNTSHFQQVPGLRLENWLVP